MKADRHKQVTFTIMLIHDKKVSVHGAPLFESAAVANREGPRENIIKQQQPQF